MTTTERPTRDLLTDRMLAAFDERAPGYDRDNRFFTEDFDDLRSEAAMAMAGRTSIAELDRGVLDI